MLSAHADEGMWMLTDLQKQNEVAMTELGLLIPVNQIYNPEGIALKDAVVHFGGGCTGEVISAEGLVLTNHHCGYGSIQQHSSVAMCIRASFCSDNSFKFRISLICCQ